LKQSLKCKQAKFIEVLIRRKEFGDENLLKKTSNFLVD
jgi:hypothetical protein